MSHMNPSDGLDYIGILASGPSGAALARRKAARATDGVTFHGDAGARPRNVGTDRPEQIAYRQTLPFGSVCVPAPTNGEEGAAWSREAEEEARRRGWHTSRYPAWGPPGHVGLVPSPLTFDCWWPGEVS